MEEERMVSGVQMRVWLLGPFLVERQVERGQWEPVEQTVWDKYCYARPLLQRLLCARGRRVERSTLIDDLWPQSENAESLERYPKDAAYHLRKVLALPDLVTTFGNGSGYQLADQTRLWVDVDACEALLKQIEAGGRTTEAAVPLLEQALQYTQRGGFLEGQGGQWSHSRRGTIERMDYRTSLWLAEAYEQQGIMGQAELLYSRLLEEDPIDEMIWCHLLSNLHKQGLIAQMHKSIRDTERTFEQYEAPISAATKTVVRRLLQESAPDGIFSPGQQNTLSVPFSNGVSRDTLKATNELEGNSMDLLRRRFLQEGLSLASIPLLDTSVLQRFQHAFHRPLQVDATLLQAYASKTEALWQNRHAATFITEDLWRYVTDHLHKMLTFLQTSLLPAQRSQLCALLCKTAQLAGVLAHDAAQPERARAWYALAIQACHEGHDPALEAIVLGWIAFTWLSEQAYTQALRCVQQALSIAQGTSDQLLIAWLQAIKAETHASLRQPTQCLDALRLAETHIDASSITEHQALFNLDQKQLWGYQGACLQQLYRAGNPGTQSYLRDAQVALEQAISGPTLLRRRITYLHDLAGVYARQSEVEAACATIVQSLPLVAELGERTARKRLATVRARLDSAANSQAVQTLDEQIAIFFI